jgi:queuosine precursor transporter
MGNELLLFVEALLCASFVFFAWRLDRHRLHGIILVCLILIVTVGSKVASYFGYITNVGNLFYATIFLATYFLIERWGRREGLHTIGVGLVGSLFFIVFMQISIAFDGEASSTAANAALDTIFPLASRLMLAFVLGYAISQPVNVLLYMYLKRRLHGRYLWLRANVANVCAQAVDSLIFFTVAFAGTVAPQEIVEIIVTGYVIKVVFVALASPMLYLNKIEESHDGGTSEITMRYNRLTAH